MNRSLVKTLIVILQVLFCAQSTIGELENLESNSAYYGLLSTATKNKTGGSDCIQKLSRIAQAIKEKEVWGLKLLDASGAPRTGIYWGNTYWLGSKKQCLTAYSGKEPSLNPKILPLTKESNETLVPFHVDYYVAYFYHNSSFQMFVHWPNESKITLGLCLPSSCTTQEVSDLMQEYFNTGQLLHQQMFSTNLTIDEVIKIQPNFKWDHFLAFLFFIWLAVAIVMSICGTFYDVVFYQPSLIPKNSEVETNGIQMQTAHDHQNRRTQEVGTTDMNSSANNVNKIEKDLNVAQKILIGFSWYTNFNAIFTTKVSKGTLVPLVGLRFGLTNFIIFSHSYLFIMDYFDNRANIFMYGDSAMGQFFQNSSYGVDAFFFLGGFLMVYSLSRSKDLAAGVEHTNWSLFKLFIRGVFRRFRRLTPIYLFTLAMVYTDSVFKKSISPFWMNERNDLQCPKFWWTNILYINNIYPGTWDGMCLSWSYYLACDMQFFIIMSFVYFLSKKYFKTGVALTFMFLFGSFITLGTVAYMTDYIPFMDHFFQKAPIFYYPPWMRIGPYIIGAMYAYFYISINGKLNIKKYYGHLLNLLAFLIICYLEFGFADKINFSTLTAVLHTALSRTIFTIAFGWIVFACLVGHGGFLNTILCAEGWRPFTHLTYTAYLVNPLILFTLINNTETSLPFEDATILLLGYGLIVVTYMFSLVLVLLIEIPTDKFLNIIMDVKSAKFQTVKEEKFSKTTNNASESHCKAE